MKTRILDKIHDSCAYVMRNSKYVNINYEKLDDFIEKIEIKDIKHWLSSNPYNLLDMGIERIVNFLLIFESIDFSFWGSPKWTIDTNGDKKDGSDALLYLMINYVTNNNSTDLSKITLDEFRNIFLGNVDIPLLEERYNNIKNVSCIVNEKMNGNFYESIKNLTVDKDLFEYIITNFDCFIDERKYSGRKIYFYKLAQLLTSDILHMREEIENIHVDYSNLIGCADYKIPQTLRALGIIEYAEALSRTIDEKTEIDISSKYEVEIRASQIVVIDYIKSKIKNINSIDINDYLFLYSKNVKSIVKPYHLCRNVNY
jgi:hypothetical protein